MSGVSVFTEFRIDASIFRKKITAENPHTDTYRNSMFYAFLQDFANVSSPTARFKESGRTMDSTDILSSMGRRVVSRWRVGLACKGHWRSGNGVPHRSVRQDYQFACNGKAVPRPLLAALMSLVRAQVASAPTAPTYGSRCRCGFSGVRKKPASVAVFRNNKKPVRVT